MTTYKGGMPKLKFGEDLAPDQQPLGSPAYLSPLGSGSSGKRKHHFSVLGTVEKPKKDRLATAIAKHSTDAPTVIPASAFALDGTSADGTTVRMTYEGRGGLELHRVDRTTLLGDDILPTWRDEEYEPSDFDDTVEMIACARAAAIARWGAPKPKVPRPEPKIIAAPSITKKDEDDFERRRTQGQIYVALGWPLRCAYVNIWDF